MSPWSCCNKQPLWIIGAKIGAVPSLFLSRTLPEAELTPSWAGRAGQRCPGSQDWETLGFCAVKALWLPENDLGIQNHRKGHLNAVNIRSRILQLGREYLIRLSAGLESEFMWIISKGTKLAQLCCCSEMSLCPGAQGLQACAGHWAGVTLVHVGVSQLCFSLSLCGQRTEGACLSEERGASLMKTLNISRALFAG